MQTPLHPLSGAVMSDWIYACLMGPLSHVLCEERTARPGFALSAQILFVSAMSKRSVLMLMSTLMSALHNW